MTCNPAGSSQEANPFANAVQPIPALPACRLAHSCPFSHTLIGYGKYDRSGQMRHMVRVADKPAARISG